MVTDVSHIVRHAQGWLKLKFSGRALVECTFSFIAIICAAFMYIPINYWTVARLLY